MRRQRSVLGLYRPAVRQNVNRLATDVYHRLNGDCHSGAKSHSSARSSEVRNVGRLVKIVSDSVSDVLTYHRKACAFNAILDRVSNVADAISRFYSRNTGKEAVSCNLYELQGFLADVSNGYRSRAVSVEALIKCSYVDLYDVTLAKYSVLGRNSVNDLVVNADARRAGKTVVT